MAHAKSAHRGGRAGTEATAGHSGAGQAHHGGGTGPAGDTPEGQQGGAHVPGSGSGRGQTPLPRRGADAEGHLQEGLEHHQPGQLVWPGGGQRRLAPDDAQPPGLAPPIGGSLRLPGSRPGATCSGQEVLGTHYCGLPGPDTSQEAHLREHCLGHNLCPLLGHHLLHLAARLPHRIGLQSGEF